MKTGVRKLCFSPKPLLKSPSALPLSVSHLKPVWLDLQQPCTLSAGHSCSSSGPTTREVCGLSLWQTPGHARTHAMASQQALFLYHCIVDLPSYRQQLPACVSHRMLTTIISILTQHSSQAKVGCIDLEDKRLSYLQNLFHYECCLQLLKGSLTSIVPDNFLRVSLLCQIGK